MAREKILHSIFNENYTKNFFGVRGPFFPLNLSEFQFNKEIPNLSDLFRVQSNVRSSSKVLIGKYEKP